MGRLVWVAIGAAGGVLAYRRGQRLVEQARGRGVVGSVQAATGSAAGLAVQARSLMQAAGGTQRPTSAPVSAAATGAAAARVLAQARTRPADGAA